MLTNVTCKSRLKYKSIEYIAENLIKRERSREDESE